MTKDGIFGFIFFASVLYGAWFFEVGLSVNVSYDSKALIIDGRKRILQSGSVHYPRATPEVSLYLFRLLCNVHSGLCYVYDMKNVFDVFEVVM